jgi:glutathione S-transferase
MKLMYAPGTCAIGVHILLEEIGKPYELVAVDFVNRAQYGPAFTATNPKSKVPVLIRDDGSVLTEYQAISVWLALTNPERRLIPADAERHARMLEVMDYVVGFVHGQAWTRAMRPMVYTPNEAEHEGIKARGREMFDRAMSILDGSVAGKEWVVGDFSLADPALFFVSWWAAERLKTALPPNVAAHYQRMRARDSVRRALTMEGFSA